MGSSTPVNVEGCLSGSSGNFSLTDVNGRTYDLVGADSLLSKYVGHRVQVSGTADSERSSASTSSEVSPKPEETTRPETSVKPEEEQNEPIATPSPKPETSSGESRQRTLRVSDVKEVADSCSQGPQL